MSHISVHACLKLSSKSSGRWSQMKQVTGETGSSTPVTGSTKMEAKEVLSCLVGWSSTDAVGNSCVFPQPPFLIIPPSSVSQRHVIHNTPNHISFPPSFSKPNCAGPQYLPLVQGRDESPSASLQPLHWNGEIQHALNSNHWTTICWDVPWAVLDDWHERCQLTHTITSWGGLSAYIVVKKHKLRKTKWLPGSQSWIGEFKTYWMDFKTLALPMLLDCLQVWSFLLFLLHCFHSGPGLSSPFPCTSLYYSF